jgi:AcrR family transcriptional regulator
MEASLLSHHPRLIPVLGDDAIDRRRARLLEGMTRAVYEKGYAAATVADVVRHAKVSRGAFYELFASKEACFLEAYAHGVDVLVDRVAVAVEGAPDWRAGLEAGLAAYLDTLESEPQFARSYMLEVNAAGPLAQAERDAALRRFAKRYGASFAAAAREDRKLAVPPGETLFVLAAGVDQLVSAHVRAHGSKDLRDLLPALTDAALTVLRGASAKEE